MAAIASREGGTKEELGDEGSVGRPFRRRDRALPSLNMPSINSERGSPGRTQPRLVESRALES